MSWYKKPDSRVRWTEVKREGMRYEQQHPWFFTFPESQAYSENYDKINWETETCSVCGSYVHDSSRCPKSESVD